MVDAIARGKVATWGWGTGRGGARGVRVMGRQGQEKMLSRQWINISTPTDTQWFIEAACQTKEAKWVTDMMLQILQAMWYALAKTVSLNGSRWFSNLK